jgi:TolB-like protein
MNESRSLWKQLRERHVIRAAIAHLFVFWLLAQVADVVMPYVGIQGDPVRWTIIAGIALFPVTIIIAWFFEHPWHRFTSRRIFADVAVILVIVLVVLSWVWRQLPETMTSRTSIAILPFEIDQQDAMGHTVSRALAFEVISLLMKSRALDVTGYETVSSPLLVGLSTAEIASKLNVDHILTGAVRMNGNLMQISAVLENQQGEVLWREALSEDLAQLFKAEEELASGIAGQLGGEADVLSIETLAAQRCTLPTAPAALERYYTARHYLELRNDANVDKLRQSIELFDGLIEEYPDFAEAMSGLAWALHTQEYYDDEVSWGQNEERKMALAEKAYSICSQLGEAYVFLPNEYDHENHWINGDQQLLMAMELQPDKNEMADKYVRGLRETGRLKEAERVSRHTYEMNPLSVRSIKAYSFVLQYNDKFDQAEELQLLAAELGSKTPIFARMMRQMAQCREDLDCLIDNLPPELQEYRDLLKVAYATPQDEQQAEQAVNAAIEILQASQWINWANASACWFDHLTPVFFAAWDMVEHETDWYWPNVWGSQCGNVWAAPEFKTLIDEQGMLDYWREQGWADYCRPEGDSFICEEPAES